MTAEQARKLREAARKAIVTESEALRRMLDAYLAEVDKRGLPSEPYGKMRFLGYEERVVPRTIRKEQNARLRELSELTGRSLSELVREGGGEIWLNSIASTRLRVATFATLNCPA